MKDLLKNLKSRSKLGSFDLHSLREFVKYLWAVVWPSIGRGLREIPPPRALLLGLHRGELVTRVFSFFLIGFVNTLAVCFGFAWVIRWFWIFEDLERWSLLVGFFDQAFLAAASFYIWRAGELRAEHVRAVPGGRSVSLRAAAYLLRWVGEFLFLVSVAFLVHSFLSIPIGGVGLLPPEWMDGVAFLKLVTFPIVVGISVSCFLLLPLFYAAAGAIEVFLYIEQNTREKRDKLIRESLSGAKLDRLGGGQRAVGSEGC